MPKNMTKRDVIDAVNQWIKADPKRFKALVNKQIDEYCQLKQAGAARGERQNATRDTANASALQEKIKQDDLGALLHFVQGKGRVMGPSQRAQSLLHLIANAVYSELLKGSGGADLNTYTSFKSDRNPVGILVSDKGHLMRRGVDMTAKDFLIEGVQALASEQLGMRDVDSASKHNTSAEMQSFKQAVSDLRGAGSTTPGPSESESDDDEDRDTLSNN